MTTSNTELNLNNYTNNMVISFVVVMISVFGTWGLLLVDIIDSKFAAIWILSNVAGFILQRSGFVLLVKIKICEGG